MDSLIDQRFKKAYELAKKAFTPYKWQIILLVIMGFLGGIFEGIGINSIVPLFSIATKKTDVEYDFISSAVEKMFNVLNISFNIKFLLIFIAALFVLKTIVLIIFSYLKIKITCDYEQRIRDNLFKKTLAANWPFLIKQKLGYLETTIIIDAERSATMLEQIAGTIMVLTSLIIYIIIAINISVVITLITLTLGAVLFLFFKPIIYKIKILSRSIANLYKETSHYVNQIILGLKAIKSTNSHNQVAKDGSDLFEKLKITKISVTLHKTLTNVAIQPISLLFICLIFAVSYKSGDFNLAAMVAIVYLIQKIFSYIQQLQSTLNGIGESIPYVRNVLNAENEAQKNMEPENNGAKFIFNKEITFKNVSFNYEANRPVLQNIDLNIKKGEMIGLIGPSGSGKTTLVDLILKLIKPTQGQIILDNVPIQEFDLSSWSKNVGYVSQDIFLLNGTILDNIKFFDDSISQKDIAEACQQADIYDFIKSCPNGLDTEIGERGLTLSGGQRQRIIIARILARKPQLLILDEATSALDNESEIKIQKVIENLKGNLTVVAIAHRLSTIINSDKLLVLDNGQITEQGNPQELLKKMDSYFYKVYNIRQL